MRPGGLHLTNTALGLDARRKSELSFVSHAHADHVARHERVIATAKTLRLIEHRWGSVKGGLPVPYNRPFELGPLLLELLPAGHILGSAQIRVTRHDGTRVTYTGDLNTAPSLTAEAVQVAECDILVMEATFGHPRYAFPPKPAVLASIAEWAREQQRGGVVPVLLGYSLGKSQEVIKFLQGEGFAICAHRSICEVSALYRELGVELGPVRRFDGTMRSDEVYVFPPHSRRSGALDLFARRSTAMLTGWAVDPSASRRYRADRAFALSDHADFEGLLAYAKATGAEEVLTLHGFAVELATELRRHGIDAHPVGVTQQLDLFG